MCAARLQPPAHYHPSTVTYTLSAISRTFHMMLYGSMAAGDRRPGGRQAEGRRASGSEEDRERGRRRQQRLRGMMRDDGESCCSSRREQCRRKATIAGERLRSKCQPLTVPRNQRNIVTIAMTTDILSRSPDVDDGRTSLMVFLPVLHSFYSLSQERVELKRSVRHMYSGCS